MATLTAASYVFLLSQINNWNENRRRLPVPSAIISTSAFRVTR
jgi:hypothetical protein